MNKRKFLTEYLVFSLFKIRNSSTLQAATFRRLSNYLLIVFRRLSNYLFIACIFFAESFRVR